MNLNLIDLLIMGLTTWRLASLFAVEHGPGDIFDKIRFFVGVRYYPNNIPYGTNIISNGITCIWCNSIWFSCIITVLFVINPQITVLLCLPFALSAIAIFIANYVEWGK